MTNENEINYTGWTLFNLVLKKLDDLLYDLQTKKNEAIKDELYKMSVIAAVSSFASTEELELFLKVMVADASLSKDDSGPSFEILKAIKSTRNEASFRNQVIHAILLFAKTNQLALFHRIMAINHTQDTYFVKDVCLHNVGSDIKDPISERPVLWGI